MKARGWGRIVNAASAHGLVASPFKSAYVAAKHGMIGLTKVTALEGAEAGVTCNAICPGYVLTPLVEKQIDGQAKSHGIPREQVICGHPAGPATQQAFCRRRGTRRARGLPLHGRRRLDHRHRPAGRRRLDGALRERRR
jgi:NAD(P)-dependent dehydrogenase (short-subunit alcohol dehydrogenase family)